MNKKESGILCPAFFLFFFIPFLLPSGLRSAVIDNEDTVVGYSAETDLSAADNVLMAVPSESGQAVQL